MARPGTRLFLRVSGLFIKSFRWHFNNKPISFQDAEALGFTGVDGARLVIRGACKRICGKYTCVTANDEGSSTSAICVIKLVDLSARKVASRRASAQSASTINGCGLGQQHLAFLSRDHRIQAVHATAGGATYSVMDSTTEKALHETFPCITCFAIHHESKQLAFATRNSESSVPDKSRSATSATTELVVLRNFRLDPTHKSLLVTSLGQFSFSPTRRLHGNRIKSLLFLRNGKFLVVSDETNQVLVYATDNLACLYQASTKNTIASITGWNSRDPRASCSTPMSPPLTPLSSRSRGASTFKQPSVLAVLYRTACEAQIYHLVHEPPKVRVQVTTYPLDLPASCSAFDASGFQLAIAETGFAKSFLRVILLDKKLVFKRFQAHLGAITSVGWTSSNLIVTTGQDGYLKVWDLVASVAEPIVAGSRRASSVARSQSTAFLDLNGIAGSMSSTGAFLQQVRCLFAKNLDLRGILNCCFISNALASRTHSPVPAQKQQQQRDGDGDGDGDDPEHEVMIAVVTRSLRLETWRLEHLHNVEATTLMEWNEMASRIQKVVKGRQTRETIRQFLASQQRHRHDYE